MTLKTIIIDDEPKAIQNLKILLERFCPEVTIMGMSSEVTEGMELIQTLQPDLVFLDIDMPKYNGFELLENVKTIPFHVVFVTAYQHFALQAIKMSALDYILKPISIEELKEAVQKAIERPVISFQQPQMETFLGNLHENNALKKKLAVPSMDGYSFVDLQEIMYIKAEGNYCWIHYINNLKTFVTKPLKHFEDMLPTHLFFRVHREFVIHMQHIKHYHKGRGGQVELINGTVIDVAVRKKDAFLQQFQR